MSKGQLQQLLEEKNITPRQLAIKIGAAENLVQNWLKGEVAISKAYAIKIKKALESAQ